MSNRDGCFILPLTDVIAFILAFFDLQCHKLPEYNRNYRIEDTFCKLEGIQRPGMPDKKPADDSSSAGFIGGYKR